MTMAYSLTAVEQGVLRLAAALIDRLATAAEAGMPDDRGVSRG